MTKSVFRFSLRASWETVNPLTKRLLVAYNIWQTLPAFDSSRRDWIYSRRLWIAVKINSVSRGERTSLRIKSAADWYNSKLSNFCIIWIYSAGFSLIWEKFTFWSISSISIWKESLETLTFSKFRELVWVRRAWLGDTISPHAKFLYSDWSPGHVEI